MTLEGWYFVSQIVAAAAVVGSLVFVGLQIRNQARATRAQTQQTITASALSAVQVFAGQAEAIHKGIVSRDPQFADLGDADRLRFLTSMYGLFKHYENMFLQYRAGWLSAEDWQPWSNHIVMYLHQPGVQTWWGLRRASYHSEFAAFLDASRKPDELNVADLAPTSPTTVRAEPQPERETGD